MEYVYAIETMHKSISIYFHRLVYLQTIVHYSDKFLKIDQQAHSHCYMCSSLCLLVCYHADSLFRFVDLEGWGTQL